jgi:hypothetical protein
MREKVIYKLFSIYYIMNNDCKDIKDQEKCKKGLIV